MAYNYPYPTGQPYFPQNQTYFPQIPPVKQGFEQPMQYPQQSGYGTQPMQQNPSLVKVLSEAEAQSYPVAFGASVAMLDTQQPKLYIKSVDMSGVPSMLKYRLVEDRAEQPANNENLNEMYVTRSEYNELCAEHTRVMDALAKIAERMGTNDEQSSG